MKFPWLSFRIYLPSLYAWLSTNLDNCDGIFAEEDGFTLFIPDEESSRQQIQTHLDSLNETNETAKFNYPALALAALTTYKYSLISKTYSALSPMDRKLLLGLSLTEVEIAAIVAIVQAMET